MARRNGQTDHDLATVQAGTGIDAQHNDVVRVTDLGKSPGSKFDFIAGDTTPDDSKYNLEETGQTGRWRRKGSNLVSGALNVPMAALPDNTEDSVDVSVIGVETGKTYAAAVVSGLPANVELELSENVSGADTLTFIIKNNSGATLTTGNIVVNVYLTGE